MQNLHSRYEIVAQSFKLRRRRSLGPDFKFRVKFKFSLRHVPLAVRQVTARARCDLGLTQVTQYLRRIDALFTQCLRRIDAEFKLRSPSRHGVSQAYTVQVVTDGPAR
jgi:hypothetical protein